MKKLFFAVVFTTVGFLYTFSQTNLNNQVIVYFKTGVQRVPPANTTANITSANILNVLSNYGIPAANVIPSFPEFNAADTVKAELGESSRQMNRAKVFTITVTNPATKANFITSLNALTEVLYAETNGTVSHNLIPVDGRFGDQWGMRNTIVPGADIHAEPAWDIFTGNVNAIIAIIDNGVDVNHNDLNAKILGGDNNFVIETDGLGRQFSHGSHVAGIAAAVTNNAANNGVAGVDWQARIHSRNIFDGTGDPDITRSIIDAINFNNNVWTLNNSWGTRNADGSPGRYSITVRSAFAQAYRNNRVSCIAMGNHQGTFPNAPAFPASINSGVIAVGATTINDGIAGFSANGPHIDVAAPGLGIWSTNFNNNYIDLAGTSMATPHVAGLASLLKGFNTNLANDDIEQIIRLSADDLLPVGFDNAFGTGRINAQRALQFLQAPNTIQQLNVTSGTVANTSANMTRIFLGVPGLADAAYIVRRSEVRRNVTFPPMCNIIGVWGRGIGTTGFREENGRNFGEGICEVVPGTLTNTGCTLRTWIYEVWSASGQYIGFRPAAANNVVFQYSILGTPGSAQMTGNNTLCTQAVYNITGLPATIPVTWSANPSYLVTIAPIGNGQSATITKQFNGNVTLTATSTCGSVTKQVRVGIYTTSEYNITQWPTPICINGNVQVGMPWYYTPPAPNTTYNWFWAPQLSYVSGQGTNVVTLKYVGPGSGPWVMGRANNDCGLGPFQTITLTTASCFSAFQVSPNPSSDNIRIEPNSDPAFKATTTKLSEIQEIELIDKMSVIRHKQKFGRGLSIVNVSVRTLPNDIYTLRIFDGQTWYSHKILIQH